MVPGRGHQYVISFICPSLAVCITSWPDAKSLRFAPLLVGEALIVPSKAFAHRTYRSRSLKPLASSPLIASRRSGRAFSALTLSMLFKEIYELAGIRTSSLRRSVACHDHWNVSAPSRFTQSALRAFSFWVHFYREVPERQ